MTEAELWRCPECGRRFAKRNQDHSCDRVSVDSHLERVEPEVAAIYHGFVKLAEVCGEFFVEATKSAIAFKAPGTFAVVVPHKEWLRVMLVLGRPIHDRRFTRVETVFPTSVNHHLKIGTVEELDEELRNWVCEAYMLGA